MEPSKIIGIILIAAGGFLGLFLIAINSVFIGIVLGIIICGIGAALIKRNKINIIEQANDTSDANDTSEDDDPE